MAADYLFVLALIIAITSVIQAVAGFGFALLAVPLMVLFIDLHQAVIIATLLGSVSNIGQSWQLRHHQNRAVAQRFIVASFIGAPFGYLLFRYGNQDLLKLLLGVAVLFGVWMLAKGRDLQHTHLILDWFMGMLSGVLLMATSTNGPPIVFTLQARRLEPQVQRATLNIIFAATGVFSAAMFALAGKITVEEVGVSAIVAPLMVLGILVGTRLRPLFDAVVFRRIVLWLLTTAGLSRIASALIG